jgi:hypothetical protein
MHARRDVASFLLAASILACRSDASNSFRGGGLTVAPLPVADQVSVYRASLAAAFQLGDPSLSLLLDPRFLPRKAGLGPGLIMPPALVSAMGERGVVRGTCAAPRAETRKTLNCRAALPGYVVRFSEVFALGADSVQAYVVVQKYDTPVSGATQALRFEKVYQVVRHDGEWSAAREGRIRNTP